jgi:hypothetical protein
MAPGAVHGNDLVHVVIIFGLDVYPPPPFIPQSPWAQPAARTARGQVDVGVSYTPWPLILL